MKVLLTGATGFVGRTLLLSLLKDKRYEEIIVPVRNPAKLAGILAEEGITIPPSSLHPIQSEAPNWQGLPAEVDQLVHCAGTLFSRRPEEFFSINVEGTLNLFQQVKFKKAVVVSSQAASGPCRAGEVARTETEPDQPLTFYGKSKLEMEKKLVADFGDRDFVFLRPPMVLGPRDQATLPLFKMAAGLLLVKPGIRPKYYSYIAVSDLVLAIEKALAKVTPVTGNRVYYVAASEVITDAKLMRTAALVTGNHRPLMPIPQPVLKCVAWAMNTIPGLIGAIPSLTGDRALEVWADRWVVSPDRFEKSFDWKAIADFETTLRETRDWYLKSGQLK